MNDPEETEIVAWLERQADQRIDTACARVFLAGDRALKIKRRVELGYLDYSTLELRRWALDRELRFNRAAAPDIYRAVRAITREADGALALDGAGEPVEYALEMRRFDETAVLAARPWAVDGPLADALGRTVARFHASAPLRPEGGGGRALKFTIDSNAHLLRELAPRLGPDRVEAVVVATEAAFHRQSALLDARAPGAV
ncbi:MAG TPA: gluconate kinase, partial [Phenylobacterium sp.]|nr:gluconate kinase [Phenylobacterium sp.]